uniref:NAC domain-containing protein n=1 Tax=Nelumbo nucifera TaxID=4432 RepID=A0A822YPU8_NELNU|nr:TPA_asm: hypothetical protein HUJ06_012220 [Nelumbo nucifera]
MLSIHDIPVGYRFQPTDEELIHSYLRPKVLEKKSQNASRPNRVVTHPIKEGGWWKATQGSKKIFDEKRRIVGYKKSLVFYRYKKDTKKSSKSGEKTNWIMHEFRLAEDDGQAGGKFQQWVLCRIKENKKEGNKEMNISKKQYWKINRVYQCF